MCHVVIYYIPSTELATITRCIPTEQLASFQTVTSRLEKGFNQMKSNLSRSNQRTEADIHRIVSDVFRLDELNWGAVGMAILQLIFGGINLWAWRRRPFQIELETVPQPAPVSLRNAAPAAAPGQVTFRSLNRRHRRSYSAHTN